MSQEYLPANSEVPSHIPAPNNRLILCPECKKERAREFLRENA